MIVHHLQDVHAPLHGHDQPCTAHEAARHGQHHPVGDVARPGIHHYPGDGLHDRELGTKTKEQQHQEEQDCPGREYK